MSRDYRRLRVFQESDVLVERIYRTTSGFPVSETYGLQSQLRRGAVSVPVNIVEGCARRKTPEYLNFLNIAAGSGSEVRYLVGLSQRLGFLELKESKRLENDYTKVVGGLVALINSLDAP